MTSLDTLKTMFTELVEQEELGMWQALWMLESIYYFFRQTGKALSFITREDWRSARELCVILQEASQVHLESEDLDMLVIGSMSLGCTS